MNALTLTNGSLTFTFALVAFDTVEMTSSAGDRLHLDRATAERSIRGRIAAGWRRA